MAEALIAKRSAKFDLSKFEDGYEVAVKELVDAKVNHLPIPKDEAPRATSGRVFNLMDALLKSLDEKAVCGPQIPVVSEKSSPRKGMGWSNPSPKAPENGKQLEYRALLDFALHRLETPDDRRRTRDQSQQPDIEVVPDGMGFNPD